MKQQSIKNMPKTARPINVDPKTDVGKKYADRVRHGKTAKQHKKKHSNNAQ